MITCIGMFQTELKRTKSIKRRKVISVTERNVDFVRRVQCSLNSLVTLNTLPGLA